MRISTSYFNNLMFRAMQSSMNTLARTTDQLATGKRILQPSDDAVDTVKLLHLDNELTSIKQYQENIESSKSALQQQDVLYGSMNDLLLRARDLMLLSSNGALDQSNRVALANELDSIKDSLLALANDQQADGQYRFSGTNSPQQAVNNVAGDYKYNGNEEERYVSISGSAQIAVNRSGDELFFDDTLPTREDSIFDALTAASAELRVPGANFATVVAGTIGWVDQTLDNIGKAQTTTGSNLDLIDRVAESHADFVLMGEQLRSNLEDVDLVEASTQLSQQQVILSASQQVYASINKLSLFNYF